MGLHSPIDFNGLIRHYYLREGSNVADIRVNLVDKHERSFQSHGFVLRIRPDILKIAEKHGANVKIVEVPPGPPVLSTIVAELYGPPDASYPDLISQASTVRTVMESTDSVVDVDDMWKPTRPGSSSRWIRTKAALAGLD